ncbi:MAG: hypothetical protein EP344_10320 [Bacteroidetes bacterium]|nr:MAG: hypothetical protein EP344_10320 [Bacteroidota bacterium]
MKTFPPYVRLHKGALRLLLVSGSCFLLLLLINVRLHGQTCNDLSVISLDEDCSVEVTPDMVLEGVPVDTSYIVTLTTLAGVSIGSVVTSAQLGDTLKATVTDTLTGNSCWGWLVVQDNWAPSLNCTDITLPCAITRYTPDYLSDVLNIPTAYPEVIENCSAYTLNYIDVYTDLGCADPLGHGAALQRTWTVTDGSGNTATCLQNLYFERIGLEDVLFPGDSVVDCSNPLTLPDFTGEPYITAFGHNFPLYSSNTACDLAITYTDQVIPVCASSYNILRKWTVLDDCLPGSSNPPLNPIEYNQIIRVEDKTGPALQCPGDTVVITNLFTCHATVDLPDVFLADDCSAVQQVEALWATFGKYGSLTAALTGFPGNNPWDPDTLAVFGVVPNLPAGIVQVQYVATDACGNTSTCSFSITISDGVSPWAACDEYTQVAVGPTGVAMVHASTFDDGSLDNCSPVFFKARRVEDAPCQSNSAFHDDVAFCCDDIGDTVEVVLRVYDIPVPSGSISLTDWEEHASDCQVKVFVEDKIKPVCLPPPHVTVACENFDPALQSYGIPQYADNCCLDTAYEFTPNYALFDTMCNRGTITRIFRAFDCYGLSSQCTQRVIVNYRQEFAIKFPDDLFVFDCDTTGVYGPTPEVFGADCETIAISYQDNVSTGGVLSCYWIERRWMVVDWCSYNPNLPLVEVPNPNPVGDPLDPQNIPGPVVAPVGHIPPPTKMRITPSDPEPTDYSVFWDATANGYLYRQIISVRDNQPPKIRGCPATKPVEFCDHTENDPEFWNAPYWAHPHIPGSTDMCESITELAVTASDGCSKGNVNIRYMLFLDLDNDGKEETVINSINPPPAGMVYFGNALNPNFTGGELRAFDQRPVPPEEKYRFSIVRAGFVNVTGYVRWNTAKNPDQYVIPQLPHGDHRIMWIIDDGCGNETICEYPIRVRDCHVPDLICLNGLSVDIPQDGAITLYFTDFLWYVNDNCTPADHVRIGIRKSGAGLGFPFNPDGTPQTAVTFDCNELGPQFVEIWAMDMSGNFIVCETYVLVQDNFGICPSTLGTVAGLVQTENDDGVEEVTVALDGVHPALPSIGIFGLSDPLGTFRFSNALPFGFNLTLTPSKDNDPLNGVSTFDLVLINQHILGISLLNSPYKRIAADVNKSGSISTFDVLELRKLILGVYTEFPNNTSWRFIDKTYQFPDPVNPFSQPFPEFRKIPNLFTNMYQEDFVAVKVGDVNGNAVTNSVQVQTDRSAGTMLFDVSCNGGTSMIEAGKEASVTLTAAGPLSGFQFTLLFPGLEFLDLVPGPEMGPDNFAIFREDGALTVSWDGNGKPGFTLRFRAKEPVSISQALQISSLKTRAEAYSFSPAGVTVFDVALRYEDASVRNMGFELYGNHPNPWTDRTNIRFYMPEASEVTLLVYDPSGQLILRETRWFEQGYQMFGVDNLPESTAGLLLYQLQTMYGRAAGKMLLHRK